MAKDLSRLVRQATSNLQKCLQASWIHKVLLTLSSTWLCIKYPFLYPRNRYTGLHYNNWTVLNWIKQLYANYRIFGMAGKPSETRQYYYELTGRFEQYWTNWWALPLVDILSWIHDNPMQWLHCFTSHTELDSLPETWKNDFGLDWARDLKKYLKTHNIKNYHISQIKEKWGEFDWLFPPDFKGAADINHKYVCRSKQICIDCGRPATMVTPLNRWKNYYCSKCAPEYAYPISRTSIDLTKSEVEALKNELLNIDGEISLAQDSYTSPIILNYNDAELSLSD